MFGLQRGIYNVCSVNIGLQRLVGKHWSTMFGL